MRALEDAGRAVVGPHFSAAGIDFAGSLDPVILARMLEQAGEVPTPQRIADVRRQYPDHLRRRLAQQPATPAPGQAPSGALPGVHTLLQRLAAHRPHYTRGLLTGNFEEGARIKLEHCGIDHDSFSIRVYGDDSPHNPPRRDHLTPVAMHRFALATGDPIPPHRVLIIGDTTHDVGCATAHGARCLAVTTGGHTRERLAQAGADLVLDSLEATDAILQWIDRLSHQAHQATASPRRADQRGET